MSIDPAFDTPFDNYGQVGSFVAPVALPPLGPLDGTLVGLPCINPDWLRLVLGCVDQLRNRSSWLASYTDTQMVAILGAVEQLRVALQMANPCCDVALRLQPDCVLQYSTDGGTTWTDVAGWADNFANCVQGAIIPPPPLLPPGSPIQQRACNIAEYLATNVIHEAISQAINAYNNNLSLLALAGNIAAATFAFELPWTAAFIYGVYDLYAYFTAGNIADLRTADADTTLWSEVSCAIFGAIKNDGAITATNCGAVISAICAISYAHPVAISAICAYVTALGCDQLRSLQAVGALAVGDCSGCGINWCRRFDFRTGDQGWAPQSAGQAVLVGGVGWRSVNIGGNGVLQIFLAFPATTITDFYMEYGRSEGGFGDNTAYFYRGGVDIGNIALPTGPTPDGTVFNTTFGGAVFDTVYIHMNTPGSGGAVMDVNAVQLAGPGINPFGVDNCL